MAAGTGSQARGPAPASSVEQEATVGGTLRTRRLFGFDFVDDTTFDTVVDRIVSEQPDDGRLPLVVTPNVDDIVQLHGAQYADLLDAERRARYVLPDGQPIIWTSRLGGTPLAGRLPGSSLFPPLWSRLVAGHRRVLLVASSDEVAAGLGAQYPELVTIVPPFFDVTDASQLQQVVASVTDLVRTHRPEFVFLGVGFPKQQRVALGVMAALAADRSTKGEGGARPGPPPMFLLLGGSFNMHLGLAKRAPAWVQRFGMEWFYRFLLEPKRLFRRYFLTDTRFLPMMIGEVRRLRRGSGRTS